jgi:hypothetical protein
LLEGVKEGSARVWGWVPNCCAAWRQFGNGLTAVCNRFWLVRCFKVPLLTAAAAIGTVPGFVAFYAGLWLAAGVGWLGSFGTALAVEVGLTLKRWKAGTSGISSLTAAARSL